MKAARRASGAVIAAVDEVLENRATNAFCCVRPPGHHANADKARGFCLFNNVVVGIRHAQQKFGIKKVAILDWDVHHGNGTQDLIWSDHGIAFVSMHQYPFYPGSGSISEKGDHENVLNIPLVGMYNILRFAIATMFNRSFS